MGKIRIGRSVGLREFDSSVKVRDDGTAAAKTMSEEEKAQIVDGIMRLDEDKRVAALRAAGLVDEANEYERSLAEQHIQYLNQQRMAERLAEIMAMDDEGERLAVLLEEGFDDEAKALSEKLTREAAPKMSPDEGAVEAAGDASGKDKGLSASDASSASDGVRTAKKSTPAKSKAAAQGARKKKTTEKKA